MILNETMIREILLDNPNKALIAEGEKYCKRARFHIHGAGKETQIERITTHEIQSDYENRKKNTVTNKPLFARLSRPIDKVFTAKGGSFYINIPDAADKRARALLSNVADGISARKYIETVWVEHLKDDPYGIVFMEVMDKVSAAKAKQEGRPRTYPTYKPISDIYDYRPTGNRLEYIVFALSKAQIKSLELDENGTYYRVVDDAADYIVKVEQKEISIQSSLTLVNIFGYVPAIRNSDILDPVTPLGVVSVFDKVFELADAYLFKGSVKAVHDMHHGFPKLISFPSECSACNGTGLLGEKDCHKCNGSGKVVATKPAEVTMLPDPSKLSKENHIVYPAEWMSWLSPNKDFHEIATQDREELENAMFVTVWGTQSKLRTAGMSAGKTGDAKTATEVMDDMQPQSDALNPISEMAEAREKFIVDCIMKVEVSPTYPGCSLSYGRRYMIESPDAIWDKYIDAKTKGAPGNVLDELLNEYFDAKYQSDPIGLAIAKKLMYVEPFVHLTAQQLQSLNPSEDDYKAKLYYSEWVSMISEAELVAFDIKALKDSLNVFAKGKQLNKPEPKQIGNAA